MQDKIIYEQPLNERVRTFLRLEHLFNITRQHMLNGNESDNRAAITGLLNIVDLLSRSDIRADIIKELDRHASTLNSLNNNPNVDQVRLKSVLDNIITLLDALKKTSYQPGLNIRQDEFITSIRQRSTMPGGSCNFDLPNYHYWLHKPSEERLNDLNYWQSDLLLMNDGLKLALHIIRNSATPSNERAVSGFFQKPIESSTTCQLIRVILPVSARYYPEISGGKHRFTVRFLEQASTRTRPVQVQDDIDFELHCCIL
ncbi:MAG: cell division protein ZapD [Gammaproteobacteria bacterium]